MMSRGITWLGSIPRIALAIGALIAAWGWSWGYVWAAAWTFSPLWNCGAVSVWVLLIVAFLIPRSWFSNRPMALGMVLLGVAAAGYLAAALALPQAAPVIPGLWEFLLVLLGGIRIIFAAISMARARASAQGTSDLS